MPDRLGVILSLPGKPLVYYQTQLPQTEVENILDQMLQSMNPAFSNKQRLQLYQQVYDWLMTKHNEDPNFTFSLRQKGSKLAIKIPKISEPI